MRKFEKVMKSREKVKRAKEEVLRDFCVLIILS